MGKTTIAATHCNVSHQDQIWKDHVKKERAMTKLWSRDWGFLPEQYQEMRKKAEDAGVITRRSSKSSTHSFSSEPLKLPPLQPPKQDTSRPFPKIASPLSISCSKVASPLSKVASQEAARSFPKVTSREVGWRSSRQYNLEVYGRWGKPRHSIEHQLKWPNDAVP